ncbi:MAG: aminotransferase class V-fold PLP-dependent enzyme, partial [Thaumarchaeota archaeon]|nr:aminotransferase class V-fold PLP-dependent enzyme [Nitrososphaerota archaeon]
MDSHSTTPVDPRVLEAMLPYFGARFGNASSLDHSYGHEAAEAVEAARGSVAGLVGARPEEIVFTSGATESNNIALVGGMDRYADRGNHIITCVTEHKAVLETVKWLEGRGKRVTYLPVDRNGEVDLAELEGAITDQTVIISIMAANNEIGTIADLKAIGEIAHKRGVLFHTDAAQAV